MTEKTITKQTFPKCCKWIITAIVCGFAIMNTTYAQGTAKPNPLQQVKTYISQKNYNKAENLLSNYYKKHQKDLETIWLYAQVAHWNHHDALSASLFKSAIDLAPEDYNLKLDYARMSYESGRTNTALSLVSEIKAQGKATVEALLIEAHILFWYGKIKEAQSIIEYINSFYPGTYITKELDEKIDALSKTHIKSNLDYQGDNQPMHVLNQQLSLEKFKSWLWSPKLSACFANFTPTQHILETSISNSIVLGKYGVSATASGGIYKNFNDKMNWTGSLGISYKPNNISRINAGLTRMPYLGTLRSTTSSIVQNNAYLNIESELIKRFSLHFGYNLQFFDDHNQINSVGGWILSKPRPQKRLTIQYGYGLSYSSSKFNVFESALPLSTLINQYTDGMPIEGIFDPYFSPQNQFVNTALLVLNYRPNSKLQFGLKANYGFYAVCDNPYFYLENSNNELTIAKKYSKVSFNPYDVQANVNYKFSSHFDAGLKYNYQETFFYNRNLFSLSLHYVL